MKGQFSGWAVIGYCLIPCLEFRALKYSLAPDGLYSRHIMKKPKFGLPQMKYEIVQGEIL
jgi:hypothetical protein